MAETLKFGTDGNWATKKGSTLAYNSENGNFKPLPFTFDRSTSATRVNKEGLIEVVSNNEPRIDFLNDSKGALLLEPTRSNNITYSNDFLDSSWLPTGLTVSSDGVISPDGTANAFTITNTAASGIIQKAISLTGLRVVSIFAKKGTHRYLRLGAYGGTSSYANFDLENGVVSDGTNAEIEYYGNGWYRCICHSVDGTTGGVQIYPSNRSVGPPTTNGSIEIYGAQLEQGSYATSYIPTQGSIGTRVAENCSQTPPSGIIGQTEGTMFFEIDFKNTSEVAGAWSISSGSSANRITMNTIGFSSTQFTLSIAQNYNSSSTKLASTNVTYIDNHKVAIKYSATTLKLFVDGQLSDSVSTDGFGNYTKFYIGGNQVGVGGDARKFIQADLYNTALTDQELINLTKI